MVNLKQKLLAKIIANAVAAGFFARTICLETIKEYNNYMDNMNNLAVIVIKTGLCTEEETLEAVREAYISGLNRGGKIK